MATETRLLNAVPIRVDATVLPVDGYREFHALDLQAGSATSPSDCDLTSCTLSLVVCSTVGGTSVLSGGEVGAYTSTGVRLTAAASGLYAVNITPAAISTTLSGAGTWPYYVHAQWAAGDPSLPSLRKTLVRGDLTISWEAN